MKILAPFLFIIVIVGIVKIGRIFIWKKHKIDSNVIQLDETEDFYINENQN